MNPARAFPCTPKFGVDPPGNLMNNTTDTLEEGTGGLVSDHGLLVSHLHDQFWSDEYYRAAGYLRRWVKDRGERWATELFEALDAMSSLSEQDQETVRETNAARRLIKSYFRKTQQLCSRGFLEPEDLRDHLTMSQRLETLFQIIEPFEEARKGGYTREMFDFYDALHGRELDRPAR